MTPSAGERRTPRPRIRNGLRLLAVATMAVMAAVPALASPAHAATPTPDPLFVVQGGEIGKTNCNYTSGGTLNDDAIKLFKATYPSTKITPVAYSVCDTVNNVSAGSGTDIINKAAAALASQINTAVPPNAQGLPKVDVVAESLGTIISRQCLLMTYKEPTNAAYLPCRRIDDWIGLVPPSHGTYASTLPAVTENTCYQYATACKRLSSGPHLSTTNMCGLFLPTAQKVCTSLNPNAEYQKSIVQGAPGIPDETPGPTAYTTVYSYNDEFVFLNTTTAYGSPHPSPLEGATNVLARYETHLSVGQLVPFTPQGSTVSHPARVRISGVSTLVPFVPLSITVEESKPTVAGSNPPVPAPFCTDEIATGAVQLLDDSVTQAPTPLSAPILATCT